MINANKNLISMFRNCFNDLEIELLEFCSSLSFFTKNLLNLYLKYSAKEEASSSIIDDFLNYSFITERIVSFGDTTFEFYYLHELIKENFDVSPQKKAKYICVLRDYNNSTTDINNDNLRKMLFEEELSLGLSIGEYDQWKMAFQFCIENKHIKESKKLIDLYNETVKSSKHHKYYENMILWFKYYEIVVKYLDNEPVSDLIDCANKILKETNELELTIYLYSFISILYLDMNNYKTAYRTLYKALIACHKSNDINVNIVSSLYLNCMYVCIKSKNYIKAREYSVVLKENLSQLNPNLKIAVNRANALLEYKTFNFDTALQLYKNTESLMIKQQNQRQIIRAENNNTLVPKPMFYVDEHCIYDRVGEILIHQGKFEKAIDIYNNFLVSQEKINSPIGVAWVKYNLGRAQYLSGNLQQAHRCFNESLNEFNSMRQFENSAYVYGEQSYVYQYSGLLENSINCLNKSVDIFLQFHMKKEAIFYFNHLGRLYQSQGFLNISEKIFDFCLDFFSKNSCDENIGWIYNNYARNFMFKEDYENAEYFFKRARTEFRKSKNMRGVVYATNNLGELSLKNGELLKGKQLLLNSLSAKEDMGDQHAICYTYRELGEYYLRIKRYDEASIMLNRSLKICKKFKFDMLLGDISISLAKCYDAQGDLLQANTYFRLACNAYYTQNFLSRLANCYEIEADSTKCRNNTKLKHIKKLQSLIINLRLKKQQDLINKYVDVIIEKVKKEIDEQVE